MGQILSQPITDKHSDQGEDERLAYGLSSMQGWRFSMEDAHATVLDLKRGGEKSDVPTRIEDRVSFFGVYDGHGGDKVALYTGEHLHNIVAKQGPFARKDYGQALKDGFLGTDRAILEDSSFARDPSGCTATTAIVTENKIYVANAGDSRTVLGVKGIAKPLSFDHKPNNEGERARICAAGGYVEVGRVNGNLALSRAIGDFDFKMTANLPPEEQIVTAYPDVMEHDINPDDEFVVLACDGIWDCMHSQQVVEFVRRGIAAKQELKDICENIMDNCLAPESNFSGIGCDNMTVMIVGLLNGKTKEEWYDMIAKRVADGDGPVAPESFAEMKGNPFSGQSNQMSSQSQEDEPRRYSIPIGATTSFQQLLGHTAQVMNSNGTYVLETTDSGSLFSLGLRPREGDEDDEDSRQRIEEPITPEDEQEQPDQEQQR
uniref:protein-serine/threonine phosphatase n=1 Tax=Blastobotrys adeninivorans TaxID=409370 RepID=A0A060T4C5_BLAAD